MSIEEPALGEVNEEREADPITYQLVEQGSKCGKTILVDSLGFTYNLQSKRSYATYWQCTVRPKGNACKASVTERDGTFQGGKNAHNHAVEVGAMTAAQIITKVKAKALEEKFKPASAIVDEVILTNATPLIHFVILIIVFQKQVTKLHAQ